MAAQIQRQRRFQCVTCGGYALAVTKAQAERQMRSVCKVQDPPHAPLAHVDVADQADLDRFFPVTVEVCA